MIEHARLFAELEAAGFDPTEWGIGIDDRGVTISERVARKKAAEDSDALVADLQAIDAVIAAHQPTDRTVAHRSGGRLHLGRLAAELEAVGLTGLGFQRPTPPDPQNPPSRWPGDLVVLHDPAPQAIRGLIQGVIDAHVGPTAQELAQEDRSRKVASVSKLELLEALSGLATGDTAKAQALKARLGL